MSARWKLRALLKQLQRAAGCEFFGYCCTELIGGCSERGDDKLTA